MDLHADYDVTDIPSIVRGVVKLGLLEAVTVLVFSLASRFLPAGPIETVVQAIILLAGLYAVTQLPGLWTHARTIEGIAGTRKVLVNVGRSFNLTPTQQFWKILFPAALPTIFVGLRLGLIFALINVVGVEFLINYGGLGQLIEDLAERYDLPGTYAAICFVILVSVLFFMALEKAERWLRPVD